MKYRWISPWGQILEKQVYFHPVFHRNNGDYDCCNICSIRKHGHNSSILDSGYNQTSRDRFCTTMECDYIETSSGGSTIHNISGGDSPEDPFPRNNAPSLLQQLYQLWKRLLCCRKQSQEMKTAPEDDNRDQVWRTVYNSRLATGSR